MSVSLGDIARAIGAEIDEKSASIVIKSVKSIEDAGSGDITFLSNARYAKYLPTTDASAIIIAQGIPFTGQSVPLAVNDPYRAFLIVLNLFNTRTSSDIASGIHRDVSIDTSAKIGNDVSIGPYAVIGPDVTIGEGTVIGACCVIMRGTTIGEKCILYPNVTIMDGCSVGNNVILHAGSVIGADGFGFAPFEGSLHKIPQIGTVRIEDGVEIQACTCVDRAAFGVTVIGKGSKIDNLVQIAHNVKIGSNTVVASQTGISGSTTIGNFVRLGGQAGLSGHLAIGDGASIGAQAGVTKDVPPGEIVSGYPARSHAHELRVEASLTRLPDLLKKVREQEKRIAELEKRAGLHGASGE